jgi:hypothetical protein
MQAVCRGRLLTWCVWSPSDARARIGSALGARKGPSAVELLIARYVITFIVLVALLTLTMLVLRVTQR